MIAKRLSPAEVKEQLLRQIKQSIGDKSWRVRYMAAQHFNEVSQSLPNKGAALMSKSACRSCRNGYRAGRAHWTICSTPEG